MFKRLIIIILALLSIALSWIVSVSLVIILIFKQRHPDHCMAEYYNFFLPDEVQVRCDE